MSNIVVVKLMGGLGNQMFQYAAGRMVSMERGLPLKLDLSAFKDPGLRSYALGDLSIVEDFASPREVRRLLGRTDRGFYRKLGRLRRALTPARFRSVFTERHVGPFRADILRAKGSVYLDGYWQSEKYFSSIADTIRGEFTVRHELAGANLECARRIEECESVSMHIRRGDYVANPDAERYHGICGPEYYRSAVKLIESRVSNPFLFVFSDDPEWVQREMQFGVATRIVGHNPPEKGFEDIRLMSLCRHHILANSSFSWWGAWLGRNPKKTVVAPRKWFGNQEIDARDLIPSEWERL